MNKTKMNYFQENDILHLVISEEKEWNSVELSPNVTAELNQRGELIGIEILEASSFIRDSILEAVQAKVLDLGCDNGELVAKRIEKFVGSDDIWGIDIDKKALVEAKKRGLKVRCQDLNQKLPYRNNFFDVIQANQVIEHLWNTDVFISEAKFSVEIKK